MNYSLDDIIAWATLGGAAYADALSQARACIGFYNNLKDQK